MVAPGVGSCPCCGATVAPPSAAYAASQHCAECSLRLSRRLGRGVLWLALAGLTAGIALVAYLLFCLDSVARPLFAVTLPAAVVATGALAQLILPRRASARPHACEGLLARALAAVPGPAPVLSLLTLAAASAVGILAFPASNETVAWRRVLASEDAGPVFDYAGAWEGRHPEAELADLAWGRIRNYPDVASLTRFVGVFPSSPHAAEARKALDRAVAEERRREEERLRREEEARIAPEVNRVLSSGSVEACLDFLKKYPRSGRATEVRGALLGLVEKAAAAGDKRPQGFRAIFAAGADGPVGVSFESGTTEPWRKEVLAEIEAALAEFGLTAVEAPAESSTMRFDVTMGPPSSERGGDSSAWEILLRGKGKPLVAHGSLTVQAAGAAEPAWRFEARAECGDIWFVEEKDADAEIERRVRADLCRQVAEALRVAP